jgi:subtilisin family serine protease
MKRIVWLLVILSTLSFAAPPASAQLLSLGGSSGSRIIVRDTLGQLALNTTCILLGCKVQYGLGDPNGQVFLITAPPLVNPILFIAKLVLQPGITGVEIDQAVKTQGASAGATPSYLTDKNAVNYYGATVWEGYVTQPALQLVRSMTVHSTYNAAGAGVIVAVIDTGVDPNNPVLKPVLVPGYDFTRNISGGSEMSDVSQSTVAVLDDAGQVNQSTVAVLDQSTVAVLDGNGQYAAFGHGTMTSGIVHLVAPQAKIMPLKAFTASGSGYASDVMRAIYYAAKNGAKVLNMSFEFTTYSPELNNAVQYASKNGVISVASAGNDGQQENVYPAALANVIDVASTSNQDTQSVFTNFGAPPVWLAAPGEGIMTTYPWGSYAAGWGTSFSAPFVAGTAALMVGINNSCAESQTANALTYAQPISDPSLSNRRLDSYKAVQSWRTTLGLQ